MSLSSFVTTAEGEIGYVEGSGNITKYGKWYGLDGQPWCAMFISWCADQAGILTKDATASLPKVPKQAAVSSMYSFYRANRRNLTASSDTSSPNYPKVGDVVFINGTSTHVGIVVEVDGNIVKTVEGNSGNKVKKNTYTNLFWGNEEITHIGSNNVSY